MISFITKWSLGDFYMNAFYTILGIMFSIALGLLVTFNLQGLKNASAIAKIRKNIKHVRNSYIKYFFASTILYLAEKFGRDHFHGSIKLFTVKDFTFNFNISIFTLSIIIFSISYFIINFISMQKLNDDLYDEIILKL